MNPANITREEALQRSSVISTKSYRVIVNLGGLDVAGEPLASPEQNFLSTSVVTFSSTGGDSWIDLIADEVIAAQLDDEPLDPSSFADNRLTFTTEAGEHQLTVTALCRYSHTGEGLHRFVDPADQRVYLYTQFETADARRMYANFEQPDLKARFQLTVIAPADWVVLSNSPTPTPQPLPDGLAGFQFAPTPPISTYITALVAGEYHIDEGAITSVKGELPAGVVCRQSMVPYLDAERIRTAAQRGFEVFEDAFSHPYAFDTYQQIFVPEFNAGAMENAGCVTFRDEYLFRSKVSQASYETRNNTIWHELAHMWFGDLVTMRWWDDLWLNESFAEWAAHYAGQRIAEQHGGVNPWVGYANARKTWAYTADQLPTTHPVAADMVDLEAVERNFDGITYAKGASVLKQLVAFVGEDNFLAGIKAYFAEHAYGNTTFADLLDALQEASGRDLSGFAGDWLESAGVNTLRPRIEVDDDGNIASFVVEQTAAETHPALRTHHIAVGCYDDVDGRLVATDSVEVDVSGEATDLPVFVGRPRPALVLLNDRDLGYAKVRLDDQSLATAVSRIGDLDDPLARSVIYSSAWDMWRDAELSSGDFVDLVLHSIEHETDMTAITGRLAAAHLAVTSFAAPSVRPQLRSHLVAGLVKLLKAAEPGSDPQLLFADALMLAVHTPAGAELVRGWLDGEQLPEGLAMDADRRWKATTALARLGAIDAEGIDAEAANDQTISGAEFAAAARSALATAESKAATWSAVTEDASIPNGTFRATVMQFWQFGQQDLLADYADAYLRLAETISAKQGAWAGRGHQSVEMALLHLWPTPLADQAFLDRVDGWLAETELADSVRNVVRERADLSARALRVQAVQPD